jgi:hypothetical protein
MFKLINNNMPLMPSVIDVYPTAEAAIAFLKNLYKELYIDAEGDCFDILAVNGAVADIFAVEPVKA